ncbi:MAG TPA: acyl-CoA dehydrogenase family protein [Longimicrobiales bacterium]
MPTAEMQEIRQLARQFAEAELRPHVEKWDHDARLDEQALKQLAELGFFGMLIPEAYGGMEFDLPTYVSVIEELAWGEPSVALTVAATSFVANLIVRNGSDEQKRKWLEPIARGEVLACFAMSEEAAGSDAASLSARAARAGEQWTLNGEKKWVTNGSTAQLALVLARTGSSDNGVRGIGAFLVPTNAAGYQVGKREQTMGFRPLEIVTVNLNDLRLDADAVLGEPAQGFLYASQTLDVGRLAISAIAVGIAQAAVEYATSYADIREQFGEKLRKFEGVQFKLADMATRVEAARALLHYVAAEPTSKLSSMVKLFASEAAMWVTTQAVQIYGGYGYMRDYPVEKLMRDAKATEILEGTNEIQRVLIARELYK